MQSAEFAQRTVKAKSLIKFYSVVVSALILFIVLRFKVTPAITGCVIISAGILFCVLSVMQNFYQWRIENSRAAEGLPVYELPPVRQDGAKELGRELSTLV